MNKNNFNYLAPIYDWLTTLIFFGEVQRSQKKWLSLVPDGSKVMVVGGGSGSFLTELKNKKCEITYIESAQNMVNQAKRNSAGQPIKFVNEDFFKARIDKKYDAVLAFFFLDVFYDKSFFKAVDKIKSLLTNKGILFVSDFENDGHVAWKGTFLKLMFMFFKITANLEAGKLLPIREMIKRRGFKEEKLDYFYKRFIFSSVFRKV